MFRRCRLSRGCGQEEIHYEQIKKAICFDRPPFYTKGDIGIFVAGLVALHFGTFLKRTLTRGKSCLEPTYWTNSIYYYESEE